MSASKETPPSAYAKRVFVMTLVGAVVCSAIAYFFVIRDVGMSFFDGIFGK